MIVGNDKHALISLVIIVSKVKVSLFLTKSAIIASCNGHLQLP